MSETRTSADQSKHFYDDMWRKYGHLDAVSPAAFHRRRIVKRVATRYVRSARRILDVGCGQGELLREIAPLFPGARVHGADLSEQSLADSRARNPGFELFPMDVTEAAFSETYAVHLGGYDLVICSEVLEHIEDDARAARNLAALLPSGGHLVVTVPGGKKSRFDTAIGHIRHYQPGEMSELLTSVGLVTRATFAWGFPFHNLYRSAVRVASRAALPDPAARAEERGQSSNAVSGVLGQAYKLFGRVLHPLFYANLDFGGEQVVVVAHRP